MDFKKNTENLHKEKSLTSVSKLDTVVAPNKGTPEFDDKWVENGQNSQNSG